MADNLIGEYSESELERIASLWADNLKAGKEVKEDFNKTARELLHFYSQDHTSMYAGTEKEEAAGWFKGATINKTYEGVQVLGSHLYEQAPTRRISARGPSENEQFARVLQNYQNYVAIEGDLRRHGKLALHEALIKGSGCLWTERDAHTGFIMSRYVSVDDILKDPDSRSPDDCYWMARQMRQPLWWVLRKYGKDVAKDLPSWDNDNAESGDGSSDPDKRKGQSQRLVWYWEIYSCMGDGRRSRSKDAGEDAKPFDDGREHDYKLIVLPVGGKKPLFIGKWPTPFWADAKPSAYPAAMVEFARDVNRAWPISIFKPGLSLQKWINWAYSFLLKRMRTSSRNIVLANKRMDENQRSVLRNESQADLEIMYCDDVNMDDIRKVFQVVGFPEVNGDLLTAIRMAEEQYARITGLYEILYGQSGASFRSAEEAAVKDKNSRTRIDDMANEVELWHTAAARHEAIAARWHVTADEIARMFGPEDAQVWGSFQEGDLYRIVREYEYSVATGSTRRLTPEQRVDDSQIMFNMLVPVLMESGSYGSVNNLIAEWCEARQIRNFDRFRLQTTVYNGQEVTPNQQAQMIAEAEQSAAANAQAQVEQAMQAMRMDPSAAQIQMTTIKSQSDLAATQMDNASAEKQAMLKAMVAANKQAQPMGGA